MSLESNPYLILREHDITLPLTEDMQDFSYIVHAGSIASPNFYRKFPIETMDANVGGLRILLDYSLSKKKSSVPVEGFLFFSTSEIYGDPPESEIPTTEDFRGNVSCTGPRACYDESKRFGETLCVNFAQQYDLPIKIVRPFNNYGPGLKITDRRVLPDLARDVFARRDIVLLSNGSPTRTFCYVADATVGYIKALVNGKSGESYNIGTENPEISILKLSEKLVVLASELFGYSGAVVFKNSESGAWYSGSSTMVHQEREARMNNKYFTLRYAYVGVSRGWEYLEKREIKYIDIEKFSVTNIFLYIATSLKLFCMLISFYILKAIFNKNTWKSKIFLKIV